VLLRELLGLRSCHDLPWPFGHGLGRRRRWRRGRGSSGGGRGGRRSRFGSFGFGFGDFFGRIDEKANGGSDGGGFAVSDNDGGEYTVVEGLDVHVGLVGFDDDDAVTLGELVALGFDPGDDFAFGHGGTEGGHEDFADLGLDGETTAGKCDEAAAWEESGGGGEGGGEGKGVGERSHCDGYFV